MVPTPLFWPGESHRQRSLRGYSSLSCMKWLSMHSHVHKGTPPRAQIKSPSVTGKRKTDLKNMDLQNPSIATGGYLEGFAQALTPSKLLRSQKSCHWWFALKMCEELPDTIQNPPPRISYHQIFFQPRERERDLSGTHNEKKGKKDPNNVTHS